MLPKCQNSAFLLKARLIMLSCTSYSSCLIVLCWGLAKQSAPASLVWLSHLPPLLLFSHPVVSNSLQPHGLQHTRPVPHHFLKFAQVHVQCISDAIQPSHPLTPSSPSALNLAQHQGLFQRVACLHQTTDQNYCHHYPFLYLPPVYLPRWVINRPEKHFSDILIMSTLAKKKKRMSLLESTTLQ